MYKQLPFYVKATFLLIFFSLVMMILYYGSSFLIPFCFASLLSILLYPLARVLETKLKMNKVAATFIVIILVMIVLGFFLWMFYHQVILFIKDKDALKQMVNHKLTDIQAYIMRQTGYNQEKQLKMLNERIQLLLADSGTILQDILLNFTGVLATVGILQFYMFFMIFYRKKFVTFLMLVLPAAHHDRVRYITSDIKAVIQSYISGIFIVMIIVATMVSTGLFIIGVPFAIFLGIATALFNVVPYIGILSSMLLAVTVTFLTKENTLLVPATAGLYILTHLIEANFLTPSIVGHKVSVNPLIAFIALIIGGELWGIAGMILFIPLMGVLRVICDHVPNLRPYGFLMGTSFEYSETMDVKLENPAKAA